MPSFTYWPTFPFEGDLRVKRLLDPVPIEPPRHGDNPAECRACGAPDEAYIWVSDRWRVRSLDRPTGLPAVLILESRSHLDLGDLPNMLAAELGVMTVRLERAIRSLDGVARVHVNRWGDGAAHLHLWFLARPYGRLQLQGTFLALWDDILPPIPEDQWRENLALVAAWLAEFGGRPLAEPPRINWTAPARFREEAALGDAGIHVDPPEPAAASEPSVGDGGIGTAGSTTTPAAGAAAPGPATSGPAAPGAAAATGAAAGPGAATGPGAAGSGAAAAPSQGGDAAPVLDKKEPDAL
ncbi:hypothetical protein ACQEVZ_26495 [Dactylosporangium sp. CA-152071]|uniref:hypothetical protein n=1 Tax=Dactylosporangium sp. CA-152071 TaxID=3239933 RepID=UPI003D92B83A